MNCPKSLRLLFAIVAFPHLVIGQQPNVLIITVDDMNYNSCRTMGGAVEGATPTIDSLIRRSKLFTRGYISTAVCVPSRTSMMTASYPHRVSQWDGFGKPASGEKVPQSGYDIKPGTPTLTKSMKAAGYVTAILAKDNHHRPYEEFPWDLAYGHSKYPDLKHGRDAELYASRTREVIQMAKGRNAPFFLVANAGDPHRPFPASEAENKMVERGRYGGKIPLPEKVFDPDEIKVPGFLPDLPDIRKEVAQYYSGVRRADDCVASVLGSLRESGLEDETIIIFLSDHGMPFPFAKECCYMNGTRTPIAVRWPGRTAPGSRDSTHFISALDLAPTILDGLDLSPMSGIDGRSFAPLLEGKKQSGRDRVFTVYHYTPSHEPIPQRAVTLGDYTYIFNAFAAESKYFSCGDPRGGYTYGAMQRAAEDSPEIAARVKLYDYRVPEELFNDRKDPNSLDNVLRKDKKLLKTMRKMLAVWMEEKEDPLLPYYLDYLSKR